MIGIATFIITFAIGYKLFNKKEMKKKEPSIIVTCYVLPRNNTIESFTNEKLFEQIESAVESEDYEHAQKCKDELDRRSVDTFNKITENEKRML